MAKGRLAGFNANCLCAHLRSSVVIKGIAESRQEPTHPKACAAITYHKPHWNMTLNHFCPNLQWTKQIIKGTQVQLVSIWKGLIHRHSEKSSMGRNFLSLPEDCQIPNLRTGIHSQPYLPPASSMLMGFLKIPSPASRIVVSHKVWESLSTTEDVTLTRRAGLVNLIDSRKSLMVVTSQPPSIQEAEYLLDHDNIVALALCAPYLAASSAGTFNNVKMVRSQIPAWPALSGAFIHPSLYGAGNEGTPLPVGTFAFSRTFSHEPNQSRPVTPCLTPTIGKYLVLRSTVKEVLDLATTPSKNPLGWAKSLPSPSALRSSMFRPLE